MHKLDDTAYQKQLRKIRELFASGKSFDESLVRPDILESWKRSRAHGLKIDELNQDILNDEELEARIRQRQTLCDVAFPILANLYEFTNGSGLLSVLCDEEAYVLKVVGKSYFDFIPDEYRLKTGCCRAESRVGTNGIGTVLATGVPIQVRGLEHFYPSYEQYTCSGAPIFGPEGGIVGVLCLAGPHENSKIHTLGLAIAIAEIITGSLKIERGSLLLKNAYHEVNVINKRLGVILDTVSSGILMLDRELNIVHANSRAASIMRYEEHRLIGRGIGEFFDPLLVNAESIGAGVEHLYLTTENKGRSVELSVTIQPAGSEGYVVVFDTATNLHKRITQVAGLDAYFTFRNILGQSPAIQAALEQARIAAQTPSNVLLSGESGTGKELFAHAIHNASERRNGPFVAINCGALPKSLIESELFGYEGGSFTGGKREGQPGKFELANGGTIFLDEIGDMPFDVQSTLLRVLQSREVVRVGGVKPKKIDVRIIAASNHNLMSAIHQQVFRADLYYRLNVFNIHIPALCDRTGDIRLLVDYFISKYTVAARKSPPTVSAEAYEMLESFTWPGNVRELENVVERAIYVADGVLDVNSLPDYIRRRPEAQAQTFAAPMPTRGESFSRAAAAGFAAESGYFNGQQRFQSDLTAPQPALDEAGRLRSAIAQAEGNLSRAARRLGISRRTLYRKIDKFGLRADG